MHSPFHRDLEAPIPSFCLWYKPQASRGALPPLLKKELQAHTVQRGLGKTRLLQPVYCRETLVSFKCWLRDLFYYVGFEAVQKLSGICGLDYFIRINQR